jgi:hypothetical protein
MVVAPSRLHKEVTSDAAKLEQDVSPAVWPANYHMDRPPVTKMPPLVKEIIDIFIPDQNAAEVERKLGSGACSSPGRPGARLRLPEATARSDTEMSVGQPTI